MKKIVILCMLLVFGLVSVASANLDAPAEKKVTVRSEIARGKNAVYTAERSAGALYPMKFIDNVDAVINQNQQNNTDTDAFYMGLYGQAWIYAVLQTNLFDEDKKFWQGRLTDGQIKIFRDYTASYYKQFRNKQKELNISDDDLKKLFMFKEEWFSE